MKLVTIIGSGLIGRSWALVFISGGLSVKIYDKQPGMAASALSSIRQQVLELQQKNMLRGDLTASQQLSLLSACDDLHMAVEGAFFIQECVFEDLEVKQNVFLDIEGLVGSDVILSSSTSCLVPSAVFSKVQDQRRCLVAHPVNPPYLVKLVELVPHPHTTSSVMDAAHALMSQVGQVPVRLSRELDGFALNRIQMAVIAESWRLVQDGFISVKDVDLVMSEGLGMRYAFIGPMETMHLNAPEGLGDYMKRYGPGIHRVLSSFGPTPDFSGDQAKDIIKDMAELVPREQLSARTERRDQLLSELAQIKKMP
ncbi:lambda-crystallin homolog [Eucyclogobius newberryi]|uniref:lambda-crystallin homolog n=1 Tax=Eucyclogobius newberryi TaxID=166745 RepID=UPI003B5C9004